MISLVEQFIELLYQLLTTSQLVNIFLEVLRQLGLSL